jgi:hypothetical protein
MEMGNLNLLKRVGAGVLLINFIFVITGRADQIERASKLVSDIKQIVRGEGRYGKINVGNQKFAASLRIGQLSGMKSPEGVSGLIDVILDPDFIEFDRKYARTNNGAYRKMEINDPYTGLIVNAVLSLLY